MRIVNKCSGTDLCALTCSFQLGDDDEFEAIEPAISADGAETTVRLWVKRSEEDAVVDDGSFNAAALVVGDWCDCLDDMDEWRVAQIVEVTSAHFHVTYKGWVSKWNEDIPLKECSGTLT